MVIRNEVENVDIICVDDAVDGRWVSGGKVH